MVKHNLTNTSLHRNSRRKQLILLNEPIQYHILGHLLTFDIWLLTFIQRRDAVACGYSSITLCQEVSIHYYCPSNNPLFKHHLRVSPAGSEQAGDSKAQRGWYTSCPRVHLHLGTCAFPGVCVRVNVCVSQSPARRGVFPQWTTAAGIPPELHTFPNDWNSNKDTRDVPAEHMHTVSWERIHFPFVGANVQFFPRCSLILKCVSI